MPTNPVSAGIQQIDGRRLRWEQHKRDRREAIIDAAIAVVEELPPGAEVHVQLIADKAGMGRPAVYRHFEDRADLDKAVQARAFRKLFDEIDIAQSAEGTLREALDDIIHRYVAWADQHPALHRLAVREAGSGAGAAAVLNNTSGLLGPLVLGAAELIGATLSDDDRAAGDLLVFSVATQVVAAVRLWLSRPERKPSTEVFSRQLGEIVWAQFDALVTARGGTLDPDQPFSLLFGMLSELPPKLLW